MSEIHHTASAILSNSDEELAFQAFESTAKILISQDGLPAGAVFNGLFVVAILAIHQITGSLSTSRFIFEKLLRRTHRLFNPTHPETSVTQLFPDKHVQE